MSIRDVFKPCEPIRLGEFLLEDRRFCAVYFLYHRGDVVYVGQSRTLKSRIDEHLSQGVKVFDSVAFIRCGFNRLTEIESYYIRELAPKYNNCKITKKARERESWKHESNRRHYRRSRFERPLDRNAEPKFVAASECIIHPTDVGEILGVCESDAITWRVDGKIKPGSSLLDLLHFAADNHHDVRKSQEKFEQLLP